MLFYCTKLPNLKGHLTYFLFLKLTEIAPISNLLSPPTENNFLTVGKSASWQNSELAKWLSANLIKVEKWRLLWIVLTKTLCERKLLCSCLFPEFTVLIILYFIFAFPSKMFDWAIFLFKHIFLLKKDFDFMRIGLSGNYIEISTEVL